MRKYTLSEEQRAKRSERMKAMHANPEFRAKLEKARAEWAAKSMKGPKEFVP